MIEIIKENIDVHFKRHAASTTPQIVKPAKIMCIFLECIVTALFSSLNESVISFSLKFSVMKDVFSFLATGKGGFAFHKTFKANKGTVCELHRDPSNQHGNTKLRSSLTCPICTSSKCNLLNVAFPTNYRSELRSIDANNGC